MSRSARRRGCGHGRAACAWSWETNSARSSSASDCIGSDPDQHCQRNARDQRAPGHRLTLAGLEAVAEIPDEMPEPRNQVMQQRPSIAEYDQAAENTAGESLHIGISA